MSYSMQLSEPQAVNGTTCVLCEEPIDFSYDAWQPLNPVQMTHRECVLRSVLGGIGHHIAHNYWCTQMHDPDAGFTYRQSAKMVLWMMDLFGADEMAARGATLDMPTV